MKALIRLTLLLLLAADAAFGQALWVHFGANGALVYNTDNMTNRLPDFSYAGYMGGGVALPFVPVKQTIAPLSGDNTANIQNALNAVSALPPDANGFRGAVLLQAGTYTIAGTLTINTGGVVLRGQGNQTNTGTVLLVTGLARNVLTVGGSGSWSQVGGSYTITDSYVPLGATNLHVSSASSFAAGNTIVVQRPQTQPWIDALGMNVTNINWKPGGGLYFERQITAISGNQITIDVPLCNPIEQAWTTGQVYQVSDSARIQQVGVENLCAVGQIADYPSNILTGCFLVYQNLKNGWVHDVLLSGWGNGISLNSGLKWCTVQDCQYVNPATGTSSAAPAAYTIGNSGAMCLVQRCTSDGGYYHIMVTQAGTPGPNVFLNFTCSGTHYNGGPHQRWAAGALHDNINMAADSQGGYTPYLAINNRGTDGSGQGWAAGFSIMYNCQVPQFQLEQPSVTNHYNWTIGGIGSVKQYSDNGIYDTLGTIVSPNSLYLEQLKERLGGAAVENIGYQIFTLAAGPGTQSVSAGSSAGFSVNVGATNGFSNTVTLGVSGLPPGASANFSQGSIAGSGTSIMTVTTTNSTPTGSYPLIITGTSGNVSHTASVTLVVSSPTGFSLSTSPGLQTVNIGGSASYTINISVTNGFTNSVALSLTGLPPNTGASFNPPSVNGVGSSMLTVTTSNSTPANNYLLTITGTSSNLSTSTTATLIVSRGPANLVWNAANNTAWDVTNSYNWFNSAYGITDHFYNGDSVLFDDTPGVTNVVTIGSGVAVIPAVMTNNSSVNNFTISGTGKISGAASIVKLGTSTLALNTTNDFTGTVTILGGILKPGNAAALGAATGITIITNGGTLDINSLNLSAEPVTVSGPGASNGGAIINSGAQQTTALKLVTLAGDTTFGGSGRWDIRGSGASLLTGGQPYKITKVGPNQVSLVAVNPIDSALGDIDVQQGEFAVQTSTTQLGDPNRTITVHSNATLELWALSASPLHKNIVLNDGATVFNESGSSTIIGPVILQGSATFNIGGTSLIISNALSGPGSLVKTGAATLVLAANNPYAGATMINAGTMSLTNNGSIPASSNLTVNAGATLNAAPRADGTLTLTLGQTLAGNGSVGGNLVVGAGAAVSPGAIPGLLGTLTVSNAVNLQGIAFLELSKLAMTNDVLQAGTSITYGGTLSLTNLSGTLAAGDSFKLFNAASYSGAFANLVPATPGPGLAWDTISLTNGILKVVATPPPFIGSITWSGTSVLISGTNGTPGGTYYVLTSTNAAAPLTNWTRIATNAFDSAGNFIFSNAVNPGSPLQFYLLQLH